jgi:hypothetical protein
VIASASAEMLVLECGSAIVGTAVISWMTVGARRGPDHALLHNPDVD